MSSDDSNKQTFMNVIESKLQKIFDILTHTYPNEEHDINSSLLNHVSRIEIFINDGINNYIMKGVEYHPNIFTQTAIRSRLYMDDDTLIHSLHWEFSQYSTNYERWLAYQFEEYTLDSLNRLLTEIQTRILPKYLVDEDLIEFYVKIHLETPSQGMEPSEYKTLETSLQNNELMWSRDGSTNIISYTNPLHPKVT